MSWKDPSSPCIAIRFIYGSIAPAARFYVQLSCGSIAPAARFKWPTASSMLLRSGSRGSFSASLRKRPYGSSAMRYARFNLIINYQLSTINYQLKNPTHVCEVGLSFLFSLLHPSYLTRPTTSQAFCKVKVIAVKEIARLSHFVIKLTLSAAKLKHLFQSCKHFVSFLRFRAHFVFSTS